MIRAVLVDDEPPARVRMRQLLEAAGDVTVVGEAGSAMEARDVIRDTRPDLLFLDVEMPEVRGTALAASLPEPRPYIVFATAFENYALDAIALDATDYLLKPVSRAKLAATLDRVRSRLSKQSDLERDVMAASEVQAQMWPGSLPEISGFDCAAASLPARGVGGDFYDAFAIDGATWGLLLGDASGKGMAAGLVASAVQARVHSTATLARFTPDGADGRGRPRRLRHHRRRPLRDRDLRIARCRDPRRSRSSTRAIRRCCCSIRLPMRSSRMHATGPALGLIEAGVFALAHRDHSRRRRARGLH